MLTAYIKSKVAKKEEVKNLLKTESDVTCFTYCGSTMFGFFA